MSADLSEDTQRRVIDAVASLAREPA
jgi:hypothetical protein